ncbi:hypothetical protein EES37_20485 [Streptomyces sp. ADI91-18]|nr:hypothetical protein EES37_20485 [Streptomyces sp. ADI91-18]
MTAATEIRSSPQRAMRSRTSAAGRGTDTMPPRPASTRPMAWLRRATTRAASSRERIPATHAAAISPCECPITASGRTPAERHTSARETITANSAGCTTSTRSRVGAPSTPRRTSINDQPVNGSSAFAHASIREANAADDSSRPVAMPTHCDP